LFPDTLQRLVLKNLGLPNLDNYSDFVFSVHVVLTDEPEIWVAYGIGWVPCEMGWVVCKIGWVVYYEIGFVAYDEMGWVASKIGWVSYEINSDIERNELICNTRENSNIVL